ncbi:ABC transporter ATP-binding protein [Cohnella caldifontis]|uniref:ABC transporter ATP-binding protein n=1 Tax=Cohnella caldifontis TaxID=3027471 RepID=UPI0023EC9148|nr:ABC transporter ATP-binding protein [Cohnella sp. YIM B05605]
MIRLEKASKVFTQEAGSFTALKETDLAIGKGEFIAIMGPSGSGKSTLLQLMGGLDLPTSGRVAVDGTELHKLNENERTLFRRTKIGFVFQNYQLLPVMTVAENVALAMAANKSPKSEIHHRVTELLKEVDLADKADQYPSRLSGGQQQRVAIARALAMKPRLILADEPTGNLDRKTGAGVLETLTRLNREEGITVVMVTHDEEAAKAASRIVRIRDGEVVRDEANRAQEAAPEGGDRA